jgi:uncharacterized protein YjbI with pentapeptide repeats/uncharacterized protein YjdB
VTIVGAGSTTITATQDASGNYTGGSVTASLVVSPIAPTIGALTAPAKNFGDASFNLTAPSSNSDGAITYTSSAPAVATVTSGGTVTIVGAGSTTITATQDASGNYTGGSVTASLVVSPIAPTIGALTVPAKNFGDASFNLTAPSSNSDGAITYTSSAPAVATVSSEGMVSVIGAGTTTITATQDASGNYTTGSVTASLVVSPIAPTYQSISQITKTYSTDVSFSLTAVMSGVSNSDGAYTFSTTSDAISISGGVATILAYTPSAITITASQAASGNYNGAGSTTFTLLVNRKVPSYGTFSVPAATYEDAPFSIAPYAPTTDSTSIPFTYTSSEPTVATINSDGTVITIIGQGYTTITASQAAGGNYAANSITTSFLVNRAAPTFLKAFTIPDKTFGDASFSLLPFTEGLDNTDGTYHFTSSNAQLVSISEVDGVTATILAYTPTPITIYVAIDACGNYAASSTSGTLNVVPATPAFGAFSVPAKNFRDASFNLTAPTSNSSGAFTYASSVPAVATVTSEGMVTIVGAGSTTITATQAASADGNYTTRDISGSLVVSPIAPTFGEFTVPAKNFRDASFNLTAPTSDSSGAFTYTSSVPAVATVTSEGMVTIVGAGTTTITATQAASADGNYTTRDISNSLVVSPIAPTFGEFTVPAKNFADASFNLTAPTSDSSGTFTYTSSNGAVATVTSDGTVTVVGAGSTTITATQAASADGNYTTRDISNSLVVSPIAPSIGALSAPAKNFGDASFNLTAPTSDSDGAFSYTSSAPAVATVSSGGMVTVVGAGTTTITATQDASGNYTTGSVTASLVVSSIAPTYQSISQITKTYSTDVSFSLTAVMSGVSNSTGAYTFSSTSAAIDICGGVATILAYTPSAITITATQAASDNYTASSTTFALLVNRKVPSYGEFSVPAATYEDAPFSIAPYAPTTDSTSIPFTYTSSEPTVATINSDGTLITIIGQGYTTITASQAAGGNYAANSITTSFLVNRAAPTFLKAFTIPNKTFGDASFSLLPFTEGLDNTDGTYHFTSSNAQLVSISEVDGVTATILAYTPTPITIYVAIDACGNYAASSTSGTLTVARATPAFGAFSVPAKNFGDASFNLIDPSSNSGGAFTYTSSVPAVATVTSTGEVAIVGAGTTTITATQDASGNYSSRNITGVLIVSPIAPTFGAFTIPSKNINDSSFNLTAPTTNSGGAFTYTSDASNVATVTSSGVVTIKGVGTATITATQEASGNYVSRSVTASFVVVAVLGNFTIDAKNYADAPFDLTNPTSLYNSEPFTFSSSDTTVASIGGAGGRTVTIHKVGETIITATQAATQEHAELNITATLVVSKITPVITLASITKTYGDMSFNLAPSSTNTDISGGFSFASSNTNVASIFDTSYVSISGVGSTTITITQTETTNFTDASKTVTMTVNKATPVLSALTVSSNRTFGSAPFSALALPTSVSNGAITYSSSDNNVATIDNSGVITLVASGYVTFTATQASTALYNQVTKASNTMTVHRQILLLTRASPTDAVINKTYGDSYFTVSATNASNGGAITYETNNPSVAGVINASTGVISVVSVGTATITARREQTAQYTSEPVSWTVEVARATTTISGLTDLSYNVTTTPFRVITSSISDGAVTYSLQDPTSTVLTIHPTSGLVTLKSPGSAVIVASQAPGTLYQTPASISATITVTSAGNVLQGATITETSSFANVNLSGASLAGASITNTEFTAATLSNTNLTNAVITSSNFTGADLSGATLVNATVTGATFTDVSLKNADLTDATLTSTVFTGANLSGAILRSIDASGASFVNANLNNADLTGANIENVNFTNASIKNAIITDISFSLLQKVQLLKNSENRNISEIIVTEIPGATVLAAVSESSPIRAIPNLDLTSAGVVASVVIPQTSKIQNNVLTDTILNVQDYDKIYLPINENEYFQINGAKYYSSGGVVRNQLTNAVVDIIQYEGKSIWLIAGSIIVLVLQPNPLNTSSFIVPNNVLFTNTTPFMPTTIPTSMNDSPIVYSSSNTHIATIDPSSGLITPTGNVGSVRFTATQLQNATYAPGSIRSNLMVIDKSVNFSLAGLNQSFSLSTLAMLDASSIQMDATDATAVFYVRISDLINVFKYQTDAFDVNNVDASDIKYYVFHRKWPAELKINPSHSIMNDSESNGMLGFGNNYANNKSLLKHDFIRYIALRLFNTVHGVDLFRNEFDLLENSVYLGETVRYNIDSILSGISTTSSSGTMAYDASANKYLTNDSSGNSNLCRDLMRQVAAGAPSRFYNNGPDDAGLRNVPFVENDTITFKLIVQAAATQNVLTGVSEIPSRSYTIKLILKNTVTSNMNTAVADSEMYPNSYPYSSSVMTYAPTSDSSNVYNIYSPPAPIPFSRFGYNGWYYTNSTTWVNVAPTVRNHIKWLVSANNDGSSTVADLQYIRLNLKIHNNASLPYLMIYTQSGSMRKYAVLGGSETLANGSIYSLFMNFNSYAREPAMIGYTNAELVNTTGSGAFANNEIITSIAIETASNAAAGNVEFTLASIVVGELSTSGGITSEKEYGFEADVPAAYS